MLREQAYAYATACSYQRGACTSVACDIWPTQPTADYDVAGDVTLFTPLSNYPRRSSLASIHKVGKYEAVPSHDSQSEIISDFAFIMLAFPSEVGSGCTYVLSNLINVFSSINELGF